MKHHHQGGFILFLLLLPRARAFKQINAVAFVATPFARLINMASVIRFDANEFKNQCSLNHVDSYKYVVYGGVESDNIYCLCNKQIDDFCVSRKPGGKENSTN